MRREGGRGERKRERRCLLWRGVGRMREGRSKDRGREEVVIYLVW